MSEGSNEIKTLKEVFDFFCLKGITTNSIDDLFDKVLDAEGYNLDLFPFLISNAEKYNQVEVFFQKYLDGNLSKKEFLRNENKYHQLVKTLWLYNDVYTFVGSTKEYVREFRHIRGMRKLLRQIDKYIPPRNEESNFLYLVSSCNDLLALSTIATREVCTVFFFFMDYKIIIMLQGCNGIVYFTDEKCKDMLKDVIKANQLYLLRRRGLI